VIPGDFCLNPQPFECVITENMFPALYRTMAMCSLMDMMINERKLAKKSSSFLEALHQGRSAL
jgi:hypothetical protein